MPFKKSMDIIDVYSWTRITNNILSGCFIDNIYFTGYYWLFKTRCPGGNKYYIKVEPSVRIHLSNIEPENKGIDKLALFMRKHIRGSRIKGIEQIDMERIVDIIVSKHENIYHIINEVLPRGFLLILDSEKKILYANQFKELRDRSIKRGLPYSLPPKNIDLLKTDIDELIKRLSIGKDLVRGIVKGWGLPGYIAEEILYRRGLYEYKNKKVEGFSKEELIGLIEEFRNLLKESLANKGYLVLIDNEPHLYTAYRPVLYAELFDSNIKEYNELNLVIDIYFGEYERRRIYEDRIKEIRNKIERIQHSIMKLKNYIKEYDKEIEKYNKYIDILTRNYQLIDEVLECSKTVRETYGWNKILDMCRNVKGIVKDKGLIIIEIENTEIPLDIRLNVWQNIINYKKLVGEYSKKKMKAEGRISELRKELERIGLEKVVVEKKITYGIRPRFWYERFHWLITSEGFLVIGGRDADQNEVIVRKYMNENDIFLHAEIHGGPATIIKTNGRVPSLKSIEEASIIAACYSRAWKEGLAYVDVFWVYGRQVSKKPPSGEYLGKGAFMVYGKKNYVRTRLQLAIGVEIVDDPIYGVYQRVIIGPEELVAGRSIVYAVIVPGDLKVNDVVDKLLHGFTKNGVEAINISREELSYRIPGSSRILYFGKGRSYKS
jgi:predicted ribosome quality control (RQC) complex YloA/Tae2 family protein